MATIDDFLKLDIRVGKVIAVDDFPEAKKPAYKFIKTRDLDRNFEPAIIKILNSPLSFPPCGNDGGF